MPGRRDLSLALVLVVYGQLEVWLPAAMPGVEPAAHRGVTAACALLATGAVAFRRTPIAALAVTTAGIAAAELAGASQDAMAPFAALLLEAFALGVQASRRAGLVTFAAVIAVITA